MTEQNNVIAFRPRLITEEISLRDKIRGKGMRQKTAVALGKLLRLSATLDVPERPILFGSTREPSGRVEKAVIRSDNIPVATSEQFIYWLAEHGLSMTEAVDCGGTFIQGYGVALERINKHTSRLPLGFEPERWIFAARSPAHALPYRIAGTIALEAADLDASFLRSQQLFEQPPHIAGLMNPIEPHELRTVLQ